MRKFATSCMSLQEMINEAEGTIKMDYGLDETFAKTTLGGALPISSSEQKILSVCWDTLSDSFIFKFRELIEIVGRFYDPIGVLSPVVVSFKVLIQEICESCVDWDQLGRKMAQARH